MNLEKIAGNVYYTPTAKPKPKPVGNPQGIRPSWPFDSEDNHDSWKGIFEDMGNETREVQARQKSTAQDRTHSQQLREATGYPVRAYLSYDEVIVIFDDDTSIRAPVRDLPTPNRYEVMGRVQPFWDTWNTNKTQMKLLGFTALKQVGKWYLRWHNVEASA